MPLNRSKILNKILMWGILAAVIATVAIWLVGCAAKKTALPSDEASMTQEYGKSGIRGKVFHGSDVQSLPDSPMRDALVIAVRSPEFSSLLDKAEVLAEAPSLGFLRFRIEQELFANYVKASAVSGFGGEYGFDLPPGSYVLCLGNIGPEEEPREFPVNVWGCVEAEVQEGRETVVDLVQSRGVGTRR